MSTFIKHTANVDHRLLSLAPEPLAGVDEVLVYINTKGEALVIDSGHRLSRKIKKAHRYHAVYAVSKEPYVYQHTANYESSDIGQYFQVSISLRLTVADPARYVLGGEHDVRELLDPKFKNAMRVYAKNYSILEHKNALNEFDAAVDKMGIQEELAEYGLKGKLNEYTIDLTPESKVFYDRMFKMVQENELKKKEDELSAERLFEQEKRRARMQQSLTKEIIDNYILDLKNEGYVLATAKLQQVSPDLYALLTSIQEKEQDLVKELVQSGVAIEDAQRIVREKQQMLRSGETAAAGDILEPPQDSIGSFFAKDLDDPGERE